MTILWLAYSVTNSALVVAAVGVAIYISRSGSSFLFTPIIDRWSRKRLMVLSDIGRSMGLGIIVLGFFFFGFHLFILLIGVVIVSMFFSSFVPASRAIIPNIVENKTLSNATGLLTSTEQISGLIGSIVGGLIILLYGYFVPLEINIVTYLISAVLLSFIFEPKLQTGTEKEIKQETSFLKQFKAGFKYINEQRGLLLLLITTLAVNFFIALYQSFIVVFSSSVLEASAFYYGVIVGGSAFGGIISGLLVSHLKTDIKFGFWNSVSVLLTGIAVVAIAFTGNLFVSLIGFIAIGFLLTLAVVSFTSGLQRIVPKGFIGRVLIIDQGFSYAISPAGIITGGFLITLLGVRHDYLIAGIGLIILSIFMLSMRTIREME